MSEVKHSFLIAGLIPAGEQPSLSRGLQLLPLILFPQIRILHLDPITNHQAHPEHGRKLGMELVLQVLVVEGCSYLMSTGVPLEHWRVPGEVQNVGLTLTIPLTGHNRSADGLQSRMVARYLQGQRPGV